MPQTIDPSLERRIVASSFINADVNLMLKANQKAFDFPLQMRRERSMTWAWLWVEMNREAG